MEAEACSCSYDGPYAEVYEVKVIKARSLHKCCECGDDIWPGEQYERIKGLWDGSWSTFHTCLICSKIRADYAPCSYYEQLWEELEETLGVTLNNDDSDDDLQFNKQEHWYPCGYGLLWQGLWWIGQGERKTAPSQSILWYWLSHDPGAYIDNHYGTRVVRTWGSWACAEITWNHEQQEL